VPVHEVLGALGVLAEDLGQDAYLVGGMVRDIAMGRPNIDLDIAVEGDSWKLAKVFAKRTCAAVKRPTRFGTCKVKTRAFGAIDVASTRCETYSRPGALPEVGRAGIEQDLARRDFAINAMAVRLSSGGYGELIDPFGGLADLSSHRLRVLHAGSFLDDPTRIIRGIRFAARYGFAFDRKTLGLLKACIARGCLTSVSGPRIFAELRILCGEARAARAIGLLHKYGVDRGLGDSRALSWAGSAYLNKVRMALDKVADVSAGPSPEAWLVWFAALFVVLDRRDTERLVSYFNLPKEVRETCLWVATRLIPSAKRVTGLDTSSAYRAVKTLRGVPAEGLVHLFAVSPRRARSVIDRFLKKWRNVSPEIGGREIVALGIPEGPMVGEIREQILKQKLLGRLRTREDEIAYVRRRVAGPRRPRGTA
jgi:tRNA nucleotidyltransferase (CCA-adding enzyme)